MRRLMVGGVAAATLGLATPAAAAVEAQNVAKGLGIKQDPAFGFDFHLGMGTLTGSLGDDIGLGWLVGFSAVTMPWKYVGLEVGYELERLPIKERRVGDEGEALWRNNLGLLVKAGPLIQEKWRPYVGAGFGVSYFNPSDGADHVYDNDWTTEIPLVIGAEYRLGYFYAGIRGSYSFIGGEDIVNRPGTTENAHGGLLNGTLTLGARF